MVRFALIQFRADLLVEQSAIPTKKPRLVGGFARSAPQKQGKECRLLNRFARMSIGAFGWSQPAVD